MSLDKRKSEIETLVKVIDGCEFIFEDINGKHYYPRYIQSDLRKLIKSYLKKQSAITAFGIEFDSLCDKFNYSAKGVAMMCGFSTTYLSYIRNGKRKLSKGIASLIATCFNLPEDYFYKYIK